VLLANAALTAFSEITARRGSSMQPPHPRANIAVSRERIAGLSRFSFRGPGQRGFAALIFLAQAC